MSFTSKNLKNKRLDISKNQRKPRIAILYHYMYPDDVVSAIHFDGLAQDLAACGWEVEALPCNRGCHNEKKIYSTKTEIHQSVFYRRIWRPGLKQKFFFTRLLNSIWMIVGWSRLAFRSESSRPDIVLIGTEPVFAALTAVPLRFFSKKIILVHWCFDMHPEAGISEGMSKDSILVRITKIMMLQAYRSFDFIADIGQCMRERLRVYNHGAYEKEITPWAIIEPKKTVSCDQDVRRELFGEAKIGILYSGNFGLAHEFSDFLALARSLRFNKDVHFCFSIRGKRAELFRKSITHEDTNISFTDFVPIEKLEKHLGSADIHLLSLKKNFTGISVPSKFFGSIASGRPIIYSGAQDSAIAKWILKHKLGWTVDADNISKIVDTICRLASNNSELVELQNHCHKIYNNFFSRQIMIDKWKTELKKLFLNDDMLNGTLAKGKKS